MRHILAIVATLLVACGAESGASRDYTVSACPARPALGQSPTLCDRGVGEEPRFVPVPECVAEVGRPMPNPWSLGSTHPDSERCAAQGGAVLVTYDDVRTALSR